MSISNKCSETDNAQLRMDNEQQRIMNSSKDRHENLGYGNRMKVSVI